MLISVKDLVVHQLNFMTDMIYSWARPLDGAQIYKSLQQIM
jgi:hypothetical protein